MIDELKKTTLTGDSAFLAKLTGDYVAKDLVQYKYVKKSLEKYPDWRKDPSVPQTGDPYKRVEVIRA